MNTVSRRREEMVLGLALAGLGAVFLWQGIAIPTGRDLVGPRFLPVLMASLLILGGALISFKGWFGHIVPEPQERDHRLIGIVLPGVATALVFLWLWSAIGWTMASLAVVPAFFFIFGARGWRELILFPGCIILVLYLIFYRLLGLWHGTGWLIERIGLS
jgi:hypothetical protein